MKRSNSMLKTKRSAVILSMLSLLLSVSMLLGTTYAWFTEEITSGVNQIIAGNLDIKLEHKKLGNDALTEITTGTDTLFSGSGDNDLKPGEITGETFTVTNEGSLALKYQFSLTNDTPTTSNPNLTDIILIAFTTENVSTTGETQANLTFIPWTTEPLYTSYLEPAGENAHSSETFTIVLKINENAASINNYQNATSKIGVKLVATQLADETDSFDALYDSGAYANWQNAQFAENGAAAIVDNTAVIDSDTSIAFTGDAVGSVSFTAHSIETAKDSLNVVDKNGVVASFDITSTASGFNSATVTTKIAAGLHSVTVKCGDDTISPDYYNEENGTLIFTTTHFSTFYVTTTDVAYYNNQGYETLAKAMNAAKESTTTENPVITLLGDCTLDTEEITAALNFSKTNTTLNMNACKIFVNNVTTTADNDTQITTVNDAKLNITGENLAIENGTFALVNTNNKSNNSAPTLTINVTGAGVTFGGVTVNGNIATVAKNDSTEEEQQQTSLTLVNCTVNGTLTKAGGTEIVVNSAVFDRDPSSFISSAEYNISHEENTTKWTVEKKSAQP